MDTQDARTRLRDDRPVVVHHDDVPPGLDRPVLLDAPTTSRHGRGLRHAVLAGVVTGVLAAAALGGWLATRGDDGVATTPAPVAGQPAPPAALSLDVTFPQHVVAGTAATLVVRYADGVGTFSGSTEEWGDEVATSSLTEGRCAAAAADAPAAGTYRARHTWLRPGTYTVQVAVSSYTCDTGTPVVEQASTTLTVVVAEG